jgi:hypothetical protein
MKLVKSQITSTKLRAGLDPVAGVQKLLKLLDSAKASLRARLGRHPGLDPGRNDNKLIE